MVDRNIPKPKLLGGLTVTRVEKSGATYMVHVKDNPRITREEQPPELNKPSAGHISKAEPQCFSTDFPPILCIGFQGSVAAVVGQLFDWEGSNPCLTDQDESTRTDGF